MLHDELVKGLSHLRLKHELLLWSVFFTYLLYFVVQAIYNL
jgi:hypothetical protein